MSDDKRPKHVCKVCGSMVSVQSYAVAVDGTLLAPQNRVALCQKHGDLFLLRVGALVTAMIFETRR